MSRNPEPRLPALRRGRGPIDVAPVESGADLIARYRRIRSQIYRPARPAPPPTAAPPTPPKITAKASPAPAIDPMQAAPNRIDRLKAEIAEKHGFKIAEIIGPRRFRYLNEARGELAWRLVTELDRTLPEAGRALGGRDHTTILDACRRYARKHGLDYNAAAAAARERRAIKARERGEKDAAVAAAVAMAREGAKAFARGWKEGMRVKPRWDRLKADARCLDDGTAGGRRAAIRHLSRGGLSQKEIADCLGISRQTVYRDLYFRSLQDDAPEPDRVVRSVIGGARTLAGVVASTGLGEKRALAAIEAAYREGLVVDGYRLAREPAKRWERRSLSFWRYLPVLAATDMPEQPE